MKKVLFLISVLFSGYSFAESSLIGRFSSSRYTIDACPFSESAMTPMDVYWFARCSVGKQFTIHDQTILVTDFKIIGTSVYFLAKVYNRDSEILWFTFSSGDRNYDICEAPDYINPNTGYCVKSDKPLCVADENLGRRFWPYSSYGDKPTFCLANCSAEVKPSNGVDSIACFIEDDRCFGDIVQTGESCSSNGISQGGNVPMPPPGGCIWTGPVEDRVLSCSGDADGDGDPDDDTPLDPDSKCEWNGDTLVCNGGTYPDDPDKPDKPETGGGTDSGGETNPNPNSSEVIKVIKDFNKDNNSNLNKINETNSTGLDEVKKSIDALRNGANDGKPGSLAAIEDYLDETLGAQYEMNAQLDKLNNSSSKDYSSVLNGIHSEVASSGSSLRQIIDTDISGANFTDCYSSNSCTSLYESEYSEYKDMSELVAEKVDNISTGAIRQVTNMFTHIDVSNAQKPNTNMCVDIIYDFGCYDLFKDFSYIWAFVRFCFIFTSLALARKLVFGG